MLLLAAAQIAGGNEVVKIKPLPKLLIKSIIVADEAIYPPNTPTAFDKVPLMISIECCLL